MSDITKKTIGMLIDELTVANIKCFMAQDVLMGVGDDASKLNAAVVAQQQNSRRNKLIRAIDSILEKEPESPSEKTY